MRILLLGDYSGFYKNLKEGLIELGHEVKIAANGDGFKKTTIGDLYIPNSSNRMQRRLEMLLYPLIRIRELYNYDVVQLIDHNIFGGLKYNYNYLLLKRIKKHSKKMFLSSCGTNYFVYNSRNLLKYNFVDANIEIDRNGNNPYIEKSYIKNNVLIANLVDGIIPNTYTYKLAYKSINSLTDTIPFPINLKAVKFVPQNFKDGKIVIFHGLTREGFKGTKYIRIALDKLKEKYPNEIEIIIDGKMPLEKYLSILERTNIVVDQVLSYEYGMNAIYSMAMGKVVLSGNELECQSDFQRNDIPVINIKPYTEDIYNKLEELILDRSKIIELGRKSRDFVEDFHSHIKVAKQYIEIWNRVGDGNNDEQIFVED